MKNLFEYLSQFDENYSTASEKDYQYLFVSRQILLVQVSFWLGGSIHLFYTIKYLLSDYTQIPFNAFTILFGCAPSYYFLKKNKLDYAFFFAYYPVIFFQLLICFREAHTNLNGELALIAYSFFPVICFKLPYNIIGFLINYLCYIFVKIAKYPLHSILLNELYNEILMVTCIYITIFITTYFYKVDYILLKRNIKELDAQKEIIEAQSEELQLINATKNRLFSIIAHDIRSPLSSLNGVLHLIDNEYITQQEFKELSKRIRHNMDDVNGMLENLLIWSLSQMAGIKPKFAPFDLTFIVDETVLLLKESSIQKQINLTIHSPSNLYTFGDENQIKTVLRNLINNAIKFTSSNGQVVIESNVEGQFINLKIRDSGMGIKRKDLDQIFLNPKINLGTAGEKGTGFGLFLCKDLIEKNGGTINIYSKFGKGTTIDILLPLMVNY